MNPRLYDGAGSYFHEMARLIVDDALSDELNHKGECEISASLACFLEFRLAAYLRWKESQE